MANLEALHDQVAGILNRYEVSYSQDKGQTEFGVYRGSAAVFLRFREAAGVEVVSLGSPVVTEIPLDNEAFSKAHIFINNLNCELPFGKFCLYTDDEASSGMIHLEYDLLGSHLQGEELIASLDQISGMADFYDEKLRDELGGKHYEAKMEEFQGSVE